MSQNTYKIQSDSTLIAGLSQLATTLGDVTRGYTEMEERAEADLLPVVRSLRKRHERDGGEVMALLEVAGGRPEDTGSMMGAVHELVAMARDWVGALDRRAIDGIIDGEKLVLDQYVSSLGATESNQEIHDVLVRQKNELEQEVADLASKSL